MTVVAVRQPVLEPGQPVGWLRRRLGPAWPLKAALLGFPLWWVLGLTSVVLLVAALVMGAQILQRGRLRVPAGFGIWLLFLGWMAAGVTMLWAHAPGTEDETGLLRLLPFLYRVLWYLAVTVAMLYPLAFSTRQLPALEVARWLGWMFVFVALGGLAGVLVPRFELTSPMELLLPGARQPGSFLNALVHPAVSSSSEFLGYEQPRPMAPFAFPNAWGNNAGLLLPFFVYSWLKSPHRWQRVAVPVTLGLFLLPLVYSLNRGLWIGVGLIAVYVALALARNGHFAGLWALTVVGVALAVVLVVSPLWSTVTLRIETPHSNDRRGTVAEVVTATTWSGSPLLGFGSTRKVEGNFASIAATGTADCDQCSAPPLGTQGFLWRLIFTTGFVGAGLFVTFLALQWVRHAARRDAMSVLGCLTITLSAFFFLVYDSLEAPMFVLGLAVGLMNRQRAIEEAAAGGTNERASAWQR